MADPITVWIVDTNQPDIRNALPPGACFAYARNGMDALDEVLPAAVDWERKDHGYIEGRHSWGTVDLVCQQVIDAEAMAYVEDFDIEEKVDES